MGTHAAHALEKTWRSSGPLPRRRNGGGIAGNSVPKNFLGASPARSSGTKTRKRPTITRFALWRNNDLERPLTWIIILFGQIYLT